MFVTLSLNISCGSLNKAEGQLHYNNNVTKGQELLDLKKAFDENAIDEDEYDLMKGRIINDEYIKSFFRQLDEIDSGEYDSFSI
tara:strand:- start:231 stop:482 length:252 start_codon:yes stop_codon:yes gene_type:complete